MVEDVELLDQNFYMGNNVKKNDFTNFLNLQQQHEEQHQQQHEKQQQQKIKIT